MVEATAIPFEHHDLRGERLLVLAPHPDDEVIGCGGVVARHLDLGCPVRVLVATDGSEADPDSPDRAAYRLQREKESREGLNRLGTGWEIVFAGAPDRGLAANGDSVRSLIAGQLRAFRPDLVLLPSPIEIHPDHGALAQMFCELVQADPTLSAELAVTRVGFYEIGQPIRPNVLVDITAVAERKYAAIASHASQTALRDYVAFARGLNAYRAMTLPAGCSFAEAYWVTGIQELRTLPYSALQHRIGDARGTIEVVRETVPISVIVRTKDRPALLREALDSIRATGYPAEVIVVNDGGASVEVQGASLIENRQSVGRSEAANQGVRAAQSTFVTFLDDDDLYYPEHLQTVATAAATNRGAACYTDAVSAFLSTGSDGGLQTDSRQRLFARDYDRELLLLDNYIPLPAIIVSRDHFLQCGGFDPAFDLFEDWDFLIRLSQRGAFTRVPRITCEIRHIAGAGSITMSAPEGSAAFRQAKLQIWTKHAALIDNDLIARVFERQKRESAGAQARGLEATGLAAFHERSAVRAEREKQSLIAQLQSQSQQLNESVVRSSHLDGLIRGMQLHHDELRGMVARVENERNELLVRVATLGDARAAHDEGQRTIQALYAEIARLQSLLDLIYGSRTWKLHNLVQRMKGQE